MNEFTETNLEMMMMIIKVIVINVNHYNYPIS